VHWGTRSRASGYLRLPILYESRIRPLFFLFYHPRVEVAHWQRAKHPYYAVLVRNTLYLFIPFRLDHPPARLASQFFLFSHFNAKSLS
jgi:hypothetical protein